MDFRVDLFSFRGPLDLLLYLVRKHEVDIFQIPITKIAEQYNEYIDVIKEIDINAVGDFLDLATNLMEIKSKIALPVAEESEGETHIEDPRDELVERLLEYKKYKDASTMLEEQGRVWQQRYSRIANDTPPRKVDVSQQPIRDVELWDLVSAFGRVLRENTPAPEANIVYDDKPIHVYMGEIHKKLSAVGKAKLSEMFDPGMHKAAMIGVFLAILELVRHHSVNAKQNDTVGDIEITPGETFDEASFNANDVDTYEG